jgi:hypothetical protein
MKRFTHKAVAVAVGALMGGSAMAAAVTLDSGTTPIKYASETTISTSVTLRDGAAADQRASTAFGASLGQNVAAYARVDISGGTFNSAPDANMFAVNDSNGTAASVNVAQSGSDYVIFSVTPGTGFNLVSSNNATIDTDASGVKGITVTNKNGVTIRYRLFETLTAAANPTANNTLKDTGAKNYITFASALSQTVTPLTATADVGALPSYTAFTGGGTKSIAKVTVAVDNTVALISGAAASAGGLLTANSDVVFSGDFTFLKNANGTYTGAALSRVFLGNAVGCGGATVAAATTLTATTATFTDIAAATLVNDHWLCLTPEGSTEIPAGSYTAAIDYVEQTGIAVADVSGVGSGSITRNGVRMVAPIVNVPPGWISRLVLTNTGSSARDYTIAYVAENGTTVTPSGAAVSGSLAANKTSVIDLSQTLAIAGTNGARTSLVVTVNAPQSQIDGLYQIVSPSNAISNYVLSYKN